jgi:SAM-dependent methyltransferase
MATDTRESYRAFSLEISERIAPTWERRRADIEHVATPVREWLIRELAPQHGDTVLELAAGVGDTGFEAAAIVGEQGRLICSDVSPAMLEAARRRGAELGLTNVDYRVIDAERIELDEDSVDGVLCRFAYMLLPDPGGAFRETRRVLRSGGTLAFAVWGAPERNPFFTAVAIALIEFGHLAPPPPGGPGTFALADAAALDDLVRRSGFEDVRTEDLTGQFEIPDTSAYLDVIADTAGPIGLALQSVPSEERAKVAERCEETLAPFWFSDGYRIPCEAVCAVAR